MEKMGVNDIRQSYLDFFAGKGHLVMPSFSLVPKNDKSLLLINAGMAPLKAYFTGQETPPSRRVVTCQKCVRTGDIERVGKTSRHATFFEMLGNFSFGDYFKQQVIPWAWEYVTGVLRIPEDRLYVTIYTDDDEAFDIWTNKTGIAPSRIFRLGREDNFWEHGSGPCGPCSEIHYDKGGGSIDSVEDFVKASDSDRMIEFWNLVFTQFDRDDQGRYTRLKSPNIDTGMGLERIATIIQGVESIFEIDTMRNILDEVCRLCGAVYGRDPDKDVSLRIITDHIRSVVFLVSDGILPSNEGRGYVLRRLLRRAARHGKLLGIDGPFLCSLCDVVIEDSKRVYPELDEKREYIKRVIKVEEQKFDETIDQGIGILGEYIDGLKASGGSTLSGEKTFRLYDTYGFPVELTEEMLSEQGLRADLDGFGRQMKHQRETARAAREVTNYMGRDRDVYSTLPPEVMTTFSGYERFEDRGKVLVIVKDGEIAASASAGDRVSLILDNTCFYAEMGGQVGDSGVIKGDGVRIEIENCIRTPNGKVVHCGKVVAGAVHTGDNVDVAVDYRRRMDISRNHTATHLLQGALKRLLGDQINQAGSYVSPDELRFDFTHYQAMTPEEMHLVEDMVNEKILQGLEVKTVETGIAEARKMGAVALFGEKYGDVVRVVSAGDFSREFCGGTHVENTAQIGTFKIISESGVAAGVRRIVAKTGRGALKYYGMLAREVAEAAGVLKSPSDDLVRRVGALAAELKDREREIESLKSKLALGEAERIASSAVDIKGVKVVSSAVELDIDGMRELGDKLRDELGKSVVVLASRSGGKVTFIAMASRDAVKDGADAGGIVKQVAKITGGGGGGKPEMAQAGGRKSELVGEALNAVFDIVEKMIK